MYPAQTPYLWSRESHAIRFFEKSKIFVCILKEIFKKSLDPTTNVTSDHFYWKSTNKWCNYKTYSLQASIKVNYKLVNDTISLFNIGENREIFDWKVKTLMQCLNNRNVAHPICLKYVFLKQVHTKVKLAHVVIWTGSGLVSDCPPTFPHSRKVVKI